jgi:hypothetical protein
MLWETRYSSAEMAYVEIIGDDEVIYYINYPGHPEGRWTYEEVLRGDADRSIYIPFEQSVLDELKTELRRRIAERNKE